MYLEDLRKKREEKYLRGASRSEFLVAFSFEVSSSNLCLLSVRSLENFALVDFEPFLDSEVELRVDMMNGLQI